MSATYENLWNKHSKLKADLKRTEDRYRELAGALDWHVCGDPRDTEDHGEIVKLAKYLRSKR